MQYLKKMFSGSSKPTLDEWHARLIAHASGTPDPDLPKLPAPEIQEQFVGSSFVPAFEEARTFYEVLVSYSKALGMPIDKEDARFLDFGCGWGRFLRYAMTDFRLDQLCAVDVDPDIIEVCKSAGIPAQYFHVDPNGKLPFEDNTFSQAMAYSVFTHLPETVHLNWSAEIVRVLRPGGIFFGTIETRKFLEFIGTLADPSNFQNDWHRSLSAYQPKIDELLEDYDKGNFVYLPTGGGGVRTPDVYGEAVIPPAYIEQKWKGATVRAVLDEHFWQTVVVIQKA